MEQILVGLGAIIMAVAGYVGRDVWEWLYGKVKAAEKLEEETLKKQIQIIGDGLVSRLKSVEVRLFDLESSLSEFRKDTSSELRATRETGQRIYESVRHVIEKADEKITNQREEAQRAFGEIKILREAIVQIVKWKEFQTKNK